MAISTNSAAMATTARPAPAAAGPLALKLFPRRRFPRRGIQDFEYTERGWSRVILRDYFSCLQSFSGFAGRVVRGRSATFGSRRDLICGLLRSLPGVAVRPSGEPVVG